MQLTFGNMTQELNIFHLSNKKKPGEDEGSKSNEVCLSSTRVGRHDTNKQQEELMENNEAVNEESTIPPATRDQIAQNKGAVHEGTCSTHHCMLGGASPPGPSLISNGYITGSGSYRTWRPLKIFVGIFTL